MRSPDWFSLVSLIRRKENGIPKFIYLSIFNRILFPMLDSIDRKNKFILEFSFLIIKESYNRRDLFEELKRCAQQEITNRKWRNKICDPIMKKLKSENR